MWANILEIVITLGIPAGLTLLVSYLKPEQLYKWGTWCGKALSKFADARLGKDRWEKVEDSITLAVVRFAEGFRDGADYDDKEIEELKNDKTKIGKLNIKDN